MLERVNRGEMSLMEALISAKQSLLGEKGTTGFRQVLRTARIRRNFHEELERRGKEVEEYSSDFFKDDAGFETLERIRSMARFEEPFSDEDEDEEL